jgi:hypothetical protein
LAQTSAVEDEAAVDGPRDRAHGRRIGTAVRLGEAEAADDLAARHAGQPPPPLLFRAEGEDRVHDEGRLHAHRRAVAAVDSLDLPGDQAIGDVVHAGAAIGFGQGAAQEPQGAHLGHDLAIEALLGIGAHHAGKQRLLGVGAGALPDHPLVLRQPVGQMKRVAPQKGLLAFAGVQGHAGASSTTLAPLWRGGARSQSMRRPGRLPDGRCETVIQAC